MRNFGKIGWAGWLLALLLAAPGAAAKAAVIDGATFAPDNAALYVPVRQAAEALGWEVRWDPDSETVFLEGEPLPGDRMKPIAGGHRIVAVRVLEDHGAKVTWDPDRQMALVQADGNEVWVRKGEKRVAVNRRTQRMRAWQGDLLVVDTRVSTGRPGHATPTGRFRAGPLKTPMLISRKYNNARMPWSVQIRGDVVIHGYPHVPPRAASHGCVRVPLWGYNPARWFYEWVDVGTPIRVADRWA